jgi:hypothetical protein
MKRFVYINDSGLTDDQHCSNKVSNTKYNLINFIPKNLWEQFRCDQFIHHSLSLYPDSIGWEVRSLECIPRRSIVRLELQLDGMGLASIVY